MHSMRTRALIAAIAAVATASVLATAPVASARHSCRAGGGGGVGSGMAPDGSGGTGTGGGHRRTCASGQYVNPFKAKHWWPGRTDMGVDYGPTGKQAPVIAIGDAKILGSDSKSGWLGGHFIWYRLLDGDHQGDIIYVAETLNRLVPKGTTVAAGQRIATALSGGTGLETGWANRFGSTRAAPCYKEGMKTNSGAEMARFLRSLGAKTADKPGPGPDYPVGSRC